MSWERLITWLPESQIEGKLPLSVLPRNKAMMSIVGVDVQQGLESFIDHDETLQRDDLFVMQVRLVGVFL